MTKRIYVACKEIGYFDYDTNTGRVTNTEKDFMDVWQGTFLKVESVKLGKRPILTFNKRERKRIKKQPVYTKLNYKVTKIIDL